MCNLAGYVGSRPAAPILVDMMRRQEGWDCGHYTGMATLDSGKLHMEKVIGNLDTFLERIPLEKLPGNIGIIHGRTPGCDGERDDRWGHPFLATGGRMVLAVNGYGGVFSNTNNELRLQLYMKLREEGYEFTTLSQYSAREKNRQLDGNYIHSSDMVTQLIQSYVDQGLDVTDAIEKVFLMIPSERVGLCLTEDAPECIVWGRMNYPMFTGHADHGMYMATTPQAMPEDARNISMITPLSSGKVYCDRLETHPFKESPYTVAPITPSVWKACYEAMEEKLTQGETNHDALDRLIRPLFSEATCPPESAVNYAIMNQFEREGRLEIIRSYRPGTAPGSLAPKLTARLK